MGLEEVLQCDATDVRAVTASAVSFVACCRLTEASRDGGSECGVLWRTSGAGQALMLCGVAVVRPPGVLPPCSGCEERCERLGGPGCGSTAASICSGDGSHDSAMEAGGDGESRSNGTLHAGLHQLIGRSNCCCDGPVRTALRRSGCVDGL